MTTASWLRRLKGCPTIPWDASLIRCVNKSAYEKGIPPDYLFTSGGRNRCNPKGVLCIYMAVELETALEEFKKYVLTPELQPFITYSGHLKAAKIIDLADPITCEYLGMTDGDLYRNFRYHKSPTRLESLGQAISSQQEIVGIRFPSAAAHEAGKSGNNLVIFREALVVPDHLKIRDPQSPLSDCWP